MRASSAMGSRAGLIVAHVVILYKGTHDTGTDLPAEGAHPLEGGRFRVNM